MLTDTLDNAWRRLFDNSSPPRWSGDPLDALIQLLPESLVPIAEGWAFGRPPELPIDPWRQMIVGHAIELARRAWVLEAASLLVVGLAPEDDWLVVDLEDPGLATYRVAADVSSARQVFPALDDLLRFIDTPDDTVALEPDADLSQTFELLWHLHPAVLFQQFRSGLWAGQPVEVRQPAIGASGWRRQMLLSALAEFHRTRAVRLPEGLEPDEVGPAFETLCLHLTDLEDAVAQQEVPKLIADLSLDDDDSISQAAVDWMVSFDDTNDNNDQEPESPTLAAETRGLLLLLTEAIAELERLEHIELVDKRKPKLAEELLEVVLKAPSPALIAPQLIDAMMDSKHVEEVFADDHTLKGVLTSILGIARTS